ncbi:hypothetical protein GCM10025872_17200 [Barrientosiimonas endolithica]|uniref:M18 family aminopeptidase n=1 Tax=Barrientosiimonas endolithica TaxID=1535208 RepID=A0ABM8HAW2_9MICO|nr:hypothetical protein GCM10025872_17200 [Barrientosiimonas endolithica]
MTHDLTPARRIGRERELVAAARLDNLATSHAGTRALVAAVEQAPVEPTTQVLVLFDHEEVGSMSERGRSRSCSRRSSSASSVSWAADATSCTGRSRRR